MYTTRTAGCLMAGCFPAVINHSAQDNCSAKRSIRNSCRNKRYNRL